MSSSSSSKGRGDITRSREQRHALRREGRGGAGGGEHASSLLGSRGLPGAAAEAEAHLVPIGRNLLEDVDCVLKLLRLLVGVEEVHARHGAVLSGGAEGEGAELSEGAAGNWEGRLKSSGGR